MLNKKEIEKLYTGVNTRADRRSPLNRHPRTLHLVLELRSLDRLNGDRLGLEFGGDGDNGEHLMDLLDMYFEREDRQNNDLSGRRDDWTIRCVYCKAPTTENEPRQFKTFRCKECNKINKLIRAENRWITQKWEPEDR